MTHYDAILIGGGHNGLVAAAYLAKAGRRVCVLERRGVLGGCASTEQLWPSSISMHSPIAVASGSLVMATAGSAPVADGSSSDPCPRLASSWPLLLVARRRPADRDQRTGQGHRLSYRLASRRLDARRGGDLSASRTPSRQRRR